MVVWVLSVEYVSAMFASYFKQRTLAPASVAEWYPRAYGGVHGRSAWPWWLGEERRGTEEARISALPQSSQNFPIGPVFVPTCPQTPSLLSLPLGNMFPSLSSFRDIPCPDEQACTRSTCIFSHRLGRYSPPKLDIPIAQEQPKASTSSQPPAPAPVIPTKRPVPVSPPKASSSSSSTFKRPVEPPRKLQKVGLQNRAFPVASGATHTDVSRVSAIIQSAIFHL